jgi:hypothetical protein
MRGIRDEPTDVWLRHGKPARFVWRGRMYTVLFVLDHRLTPGQPVVPPDQPASSRECWLVEATPLRALPPNVYELCHDLPADRWQLSRV